MRIAVTVDNLARLMEGEVRAGERAVQSAVAAAGNGVKSDWRAQVTGAGLGQRLARTIRSEQFPKATPSLNAAAVVWSKAPVILSAHDTGPLIRATNGYWLAIPTPAAGRGKGGKRPAPAEFEARTGLTLRFVRRRTGPSLLIAEGRLNKGGRAVASRSRTGRGLTSVPVFLLVPQVRLRKRLDLERPARLAAAALPGAIVRNWTEGA
ncbi:MAG: DUF6441 family protein [Paracoccus sp. (in: a-proteobacteria)]